MHHYKCSCDLPWTSWLTYEKSWSCPTFVGEARCVGTKSMWVFGKRWLLGATWRQESGGNARLYNIQDGECRSVLQTWGSMLYLWWPRLPGPGQFGTTGSPCGSFCAWFRVPFAGTRSDRAGLGLLSCGAPRTPRWSSSGTGWCICTCWGRCRVGCRNPRAEGTTRLWGRGVHSPTAVSRLRRGKAFPTLLPAHTQTELIKTSTLIQPRAFRASWGEELDCVSSIFDF